MMNRRLLLSIVLATFLFLIPATSQALTIGFDPVSQVVPVGVPVDVDLVILGLGDGVAPSLGVFDVDVTYDSSMLDFVDYQLGPLLGDIGLGEALDLSWGEIFPGLINVYELSLLDANSTSGPAFFGPYLEEMQPSSFTLATLTFDTLAVGNSPLEITRYFLGDALAGAPLSADVVKGSISPVPEPATVLLIGTGLVGLSYFRRKRLIGS